MVQRIISVVSSACRPFPLLTSLLVLSACGSGNEVSVDTDIKPTIHTNHTMQSVVVEQPSSLMLAQQSVVDSDTPNIGAATEVDAREPVEEPEPEPEPEPEQIIVEEPIPTNVAAQTELLELGFASRQISIGDQVGDVQKILSNLPVSSSQLNVQQSPVDTAHGYVYTANIEHGPNGDVKGTDLHTFLRKGMQSADGSWSWEKKLIEDRTIHDPWHTAPSVGIDKLGAIHVAYNLHNFPWQYKRSKKPHDMDSLEFKGQSVSIEEIRRTFEENKTNFPTLGEAEIPGNQITYPAFFKDLNNDLYLTYRFAATPKQGFKDRTMSSGIAVFNSEASVWAPIGKALSLDSSDYQPHADSPATAVSFAGKRGWTSYLPRLSFGRNNRMHVQWFWRSGIAGTQLTRPCLYSTDDRVEFFDITGGEVMLPALPDNCGNLGYGDDQEFYSIGTTAADSAGNPYVLLSPTSGSRKILHYDSAVRSWVREDAPSGATEIFFDVYDNLWAISAGIKIFKRNKGETNWDNLYDEGSKTFCYPRSKLNEDKSLAFIHTQSCDTTKITIYGVRLK